MIRSTERFLTTHVGSLPRSKDLTLTMWAREDGVPVDQNALRTRVQQEVRDIVQKQKDVGIDIVNDGEVSKPSYATYIKDRLNTSLKEIGYESVFDVDYELLKKTRWFDEQILGNNMTDFFNSRPVEYAKSAMSFDENELF